jgi:hypothetical protein
MTMQFESFIRPAAVLLLVGSVAACESAPTSTASRAELAEQHAASIRNAGARETDYLNSLAAAVAREARNEGWATQKETELRRTSDADQSFPRGALKSVNCRASKCDLQLELGDVLSAGRADEQLAAINYWIAHSQPCGYTLAPAAGSTPTPRTVRVFLDCGK